MLGGNTTATITTTVTTTTKIAHASHVHHGPVFIGRHPIRSCSWPHPNPNELLKAHLILTAIQNTQRGTRRRTTSSLPRPIIPITLTATNASPRLIIAIESGHRTDDVVAILACSNLDSIHITGPSDATTARLWKHALRYALHSKKSMF
jgi:putative beta-1,4-xylosyltransferase IRX14